MNQNFTSNGIPECRHDLEFISKALKHLAYENGVTLKFGRPGNPTDNALVKTLNERFRDQCLNAQWLLPLTNIQTTIKVSRQDYNESHPYPLLSWLARVEYDAVAVKIAA